MYTQKAFVKIQALVDNAFGVIAPVGELSPLGWTFAREKTHYNNADMPGLAISVFSSYRHVTNGNVTTRTYVEPDAVFEAKVIEILYWVHQNAQAGRFSQNVDDFRTQMLNRFGERIDLYNSGRMVGSNGAWYPSSIDWKFTDEQEDNRLKIWFANEQFVNEYDEYDIVVVPPIVDIDRFFEGYTAVKTIHSQVKMSEIMNRVTLAKEDNPESNIVTLSFDWVNPNNRQQRLPFDWTSIIYGLAGDNTDNMKQAIIRYIEEHSTHPRSEWEAIFPDIFTATEFIVTPMWNHYAIPNRQLEAGLYSPVVPVFDATALTELTSKGEGYTQEHVTRNLYILPSLYKQVALAVVPGPNNRVGFTRFNEVFPDYLNYRSTDTDWGRMSTKTRAFIQVLNTLLNHAETLTDVSTVPRGYNRTVRDGVVYISIIHDNIQYLVVSKHSLNDPATGIPDLLVDGDGYTLTDGTDPLIAGN